MTCPAPEGWVTLPDAIDRVEAREPDRKLVCDASGVALTYGDVGDLSRRWAGALAGRGVGPRDRVAVLMPSASEVVAIWAGINRCGAWYVPINPELIGRVLLHALETSGASILIVHAERLPAIAETIKQAASLRHVVAVGSPSDESLFDGFAEVAKNFLSTPATRMGIPKCEARATDVYGLLFTSGTTGPSKAVMATWAYLYMLHQDGVPFDRLDADDVWYAPLPLFHAAGQGLVFMAASKGGSVVLRDRFSVSAFWDDVSAHGVSATIVMGMGEWLLAQPTSPQDGAHRRLLALAGPMVRDPQEFERRFNADVFALYGMSEVASPLVSDTSPTDPSSVGGLRAGYHARLVDEKGTDSETGPGELWVRCDVEGAVTPGYYNNTAATRSAFVDGWFRTGDLFRRTGDGNYFFIDRRADAIRRSGENISSRDVELEVETHPAVNEAAAVAVPDTRRGHEIGVHVVLQPGADLDADRLFHYLKGRMPTFMLPRYLRLAQSLPRTHNGKVRKHELAIDPDDSTVWDRDTPYKSRGTSS